MTAAALPLMIASSAIKGVGGYMAGQQNKKALYAQASEEERAAALEEERQREIARRAIGEQVAGQFSNGFFGGTGSALDALHESQINATLDALAIRRDAAGKAQSLRAQGKMAAKEGKFALVESLIGAGSAVAGYKADWASARAGQRGAG